MASPTAAAHKHQRWFTEREAAEYLGVTPRWMKRARMEGRIAYSKRGKLIRYERADLDATIETQRVPAFRPLTQAGR